DVEKIAVRRVGLLRAGLNGNILRHAVTNHLLSAGKFLAEPVIAPRSDDLQFGSERRGGELKSDLVVALARGAVSDGVCAFRPCNLNHAFGDERTGDACAEKILAL